MAKKNKSDSSKKKSGDSAKRIACLIEHIYEDLEAWYPILRFREAGYTVDIIGPQKGVVYESKHGYAAQSTHAIEDVKAANYVGVVIPGGYAPDKMRRNKKMVKFVQDLNAAGKLVTSICHGPWLMCEADVLRGKNFTSVGAIKTDCINAGGIYHDAEVVVDGNLITSRTPPDLPAMMKACLAFLEKPAAVTAVASSAPALTAPVAKTPEPAKAAKPAKAVKAEKPAKVEKGAKAPVAKPKTVTKTVAKPEAKPAAKPVVKAVAKPEQKPVVKEDENLPK